jgi:hypothetical protein
VLTLSWGGAGRWIGGRRRFAGWRLWWRRGGMQEWLWSSIGEVWGGEEVVLALYRRRRSVPEQNISPATSAPAPAGWAAAVGLD